MTTTGGRCLISACLYHKDAQCNYRKYFTKEHKTRCDCTQDMLILYNLSSTSTFSCEAIFTNSLSYLEVLHEIFVQPHILLKAETLVIRQSRHEATTKLIKDAKENICFICTAYSVASINPKIVDSKNIFN